MPDQDPYQPPDPPPYYFPNSDNPGDQESGQGDAPEIRQAAAFHDGIGATGWEPIVPPYAGDFRGIPPYAPHPYVPHPYVPHPYKPGMNQGFSGSPGYFGDDGGVPHPYVPLPYGPHPYGPHPYTPHPPSNVAVRSETAPNAPPSFINHAGSGASPVNLQAATDPTLSGTHGWSLWRFDGQRWELKVDQSVAGSTPGIPSTLSGKFVGQMIRTPSIPRERDDTALQASVSDDPFQIDDIVRRASEVPGYASEEEIRWIVGTASSLAPGSKWVEIGTMCGRSFLAAGLSLPKGSTLVTVDCFLGQQMRRGQTIFEVYRELSYTRWDLSIVLTKAASVVAASMMHDRSCQVVYLDADHSAAGVRADIAAWAPKVVPGGLLCGHDYGHSEYPGLQQAVDALPGSTVAVDSIWVWHP